MINFQIIFEANCQLLNKPCPDKSLEQFQNRKNSSLISNEDESANRMTRESCDIDEESEHSSAIIETILAFEIIFNDGFSS